MAVEFWWRVFVTVVCPLALLWTVAMSNMRKRQERLPPGPWPLPVVGNLLRLRGDAPHVRLARLAKKHGPLMCLRLGGVPTVVASSAQVAREFLQTHDGAFASRPPSTFVERGEYGQASAFVLGQYGPNWRHVRKLTSLHLFSARHVQEAEALRREEVARLLDGLASAAGTSVNLTQAVSSMVEDLVCRMLFRRRMSDVVAASGDSLKELVTTAASLMQVPVVGDFIPWLGPFLDRGVKKSMDSLHLCFDALWESLISERQKQHQLNTLQGTENAPGDILDVLLLDSCMSRPAVKSCLMDLIGAAVDTTSVTIDWAMAELLNHPSVLTKLQEELETVVGRERMVEASDTPKLPYLTAVVKETLRIHAPLVFLIPHMSMQPINVMGYSLPAGTRLLVNAWAIGRDPGAWEDPERFWPERFSLQDGGEGMNDHDLSSEQFRWIPFGSGRRSCPGVPLALPAIELAIANLVHCFHWRLPDNQSHVDMSETTAIVVGRSKSVVAIPTLVLSNASFFSTS